MRIRINTTSRMNANADYGIIDLFFTGCNIFACSAVYRTKTTTGGSGK